MSNITEMADLIARHLPEDGIRETALLRLALGRSSTPTLPLHTLCEPALCIVAQGRKKAMLGSEVYLYDPATFLVVSVDLPIVSHIVDASPEHPYLSMRLSLDIPTLSEMLVEHGGNGPGTSAPAGISLSRMTPELLDAAMRLLRLLDTPADAPVLAPLAEREILYRLLTGAQAGIVRHIAAADSRLNQISRAITWIKRNFAASFTVEEAAGEAGMSPSSFHQHFKAITSMSPLQYRNRMRLQEARRLMIAEAMDAASAGFRVGYESPSQFSRDYRRTFGVPPFADASAARARRERSVAA